MTTVKINAGQKVTVYRNAKIFLDAINKNHVSFRVDTAINPDLLEVFALTRGGKLVDHSGYRNTSYKNTGELGLFIGQVAAFLDSAVADIDRHPNDTKEALVARITERVMMLKLPERSAVNYKEYDFKGNVQAIVLYFREDKRVFRKEIRACNKDKSGKQYNLFSDTEGKLGIADIAGNKIIDAQYESLTAVNDNYYYAADNDGKHYTLYYFDRAAGKMNRIKGPNYLDDQGNGMVVSRRLIKEDTVNYDNEYRAALYDTKGNQVVPEHYTSLAVAGNVVLYQQEQNGRYGLLSVEGKKITEAVYDHMAQAVDEETGEDLPVVISEQDSRYALIDNDGRPLGALHYDFPVLFSEGRAVVGRKQGAQEYFGVVDVKARQLTPLQYDYISGYHEGIALFRKGGKYGLLDREGREVIPATYDNMSMASDGMIVVHDGEKIRSN